MFIFGTAQFNNNGITCRLFKNVRQIPFAVTLFGNFVNATDTASD